MEGSAAGSYEIIDNPEVHSAINDNAMLHMFTVADQIEGQDLAEESGGQAGPGLAMPMDIAKAHVPLSQSLALMQGRSLKGRGRHLSARQAKNLSLYVKEGAGGAERKYVDFTSALTPTTTVINNVVVSSMAQGSAQSQRIGDRIVLAALELWGRVTLNTTNFDNGVMRVIVWQWHDSSANLPTNGPLEYLDVRSAYRYGYPCISVLCLCLCVCQLEWND
jgi:hypothetical protein